MGRFLRIDFIIGFLVATPLFVSVDGLNIEMYKGYSILACDESLILPFSTFIVPLAIISIINRKNVFTYIDAKYNIIISLLFIWFLIVALTSLLLNNTFQPVIRMFQWILPIVFMYYTIGIFYQSQRLYSFIRGIFCGLLLSSVWIGSSAIFEYMITGLWRRMSDVAWGIGVYQIFNYVPLGLVILFIFVTPIFFSKVVSNDKKFLKNNFFKLVIFLLIHISIISILFGTAVRGAALIFFLAFSFLFIFFSNIFGKMHLLFFNISFCCIIIWSIIYGADYLILIKKLNVIVSSEYDIDIRTGGRLNIAIESLKMAYDSPIFGSFFLPLTSSSAHNYYIDTFMWTGLIGIMLVLLFVFHIFVDIFKTNSRKSFLSEKLSGTFYSKMYIGTSIGVCMILLISNNIRVTMRQPYSGIIIWGFIGILLSLSKWYRTQDYIINKESSINR